MNRFEQSSAKLWITWEIQPRNRSMAKLLGVDLYEFNFPHSRVVKYPLLIIKTLALLVARRPDFLFTQNPSIVLSFLAVLVKPIFRYKLIVDAHNAGVFPCEGRSRILNWAAKFIAKNATNIIVTNSYLAGIVEVWGANPLVMPDPLPDYSDKNISLLGNAKKIFFMISTWSEDEPCKNVLDAFKQVSENIELRVSGKFSRQLSMVEVENLPSNVVLLGWVTEEQYINELFSADFTIDLTLRDNCLVCGAYESISAGIPGIVSDTTVNREVFDSGFVFTGTTVEGILRSVRYAIANEEMLKQDIKAMQVRHSSRTENLKARLMARLG